MSEFNSDGFMDFVSDNFKLNDYGYNFFDNLVSYALDAHSHPEDVCYMIAHIAPGVEFEDVLVFYPDDLLYDKQIDRKKAHLEKYEYLRKFVNESKENNAKSLCEAILDGMPLRDAVRVTEAEEMKTISIEAHPYADVSGTLKIPADMFYEPEVRKYVTDHWNDIEWGEPDMDFAGTDWEYYDEN